MPDTRITADYLERNLENLLNLRDYLESHDIQDHQLDDDVALFNLVTQGLKFRGNHGQILLDSLKLYFKTQGGVTAFRQRPVHVYNPVIQMALYNTQ